MNDFFSSEMFSGTEFLPVNQMWTKTFSVTIDGIYPSYFVYGDNDLEKAMIIIRNIWNGIKEAYEDEWDFFLPAIVYKPVEKTFSLRINMKEKPEEVSK